MTDDNELTDFIREVNDRHNNVRKIQSKLQQIERYYTAIYWTELGGITLRKPESALKRAKQSRRLLDVIIEDLEERVGE